jgi:hypothetical protein
MPSFLAVNEALDMERRLLWWSASFHFQPDTGSYVMHTIATLETSTLPALDLVDLSTVTGGYDFGQAVQAGNAAAGPGREAGQTLGTGFDAAYKAIRGTDSTIGSQVGGPIGAAVGWGGGFAANTAQQLWGKK